MLDQPDKLAAAAQAADAAFGGGGVDYLVHNAGERGMLQHLCIVALGMSQLACPQCWSVGHGLQLLLISCTAMQ